MLHTSSKRAYSFTSQVHIAASAFNSSRLSKRHTIGSVRPNTVASKDTSIEDVRHPSPRPSLKDLLTDYKKKGGSLQSQWF